MAFPPKGGAKAAAPKAAPKKPAVPAKPLPAKGMPMAPGMGFKKGGKVGKGC